MEIRPRRLRYGPGVSAGSAGRSVCELLVVLMSLPNCCGASCAGWSLPGSHRTRQRRGSRAGVSAARSPLRLHG
ncbi:hypothetical protein ACFPRL_13790 [Pseudoclavibacter helvolus]